MAKSKSVDSAQAFASDASVREKLRPTEKQLVIDSVSEAGVDVTDWGRFKGGKKYAASNPKYCYEWSFVQPGVVVVLNLWHDNIQERDGFVFHTLNFRRDTDKHRASPTRTVWEKRARKMDDAVRVAAEEGLPVRVIICDGDRRDRNDPDAVASKVERRRLDDVAWAVTSYDAKTGECVLTRGVDAGRFVDQFSIDGDGLPAKREISGHAYARDPKVRQRALARANGKCEWCDEPGFVMENGRVYLETHHLVPLAQNGPDTDDNVVALCPNHHREAHFGKGKDEMKRLLTSKLKPSRGGPCS